VTARRLKSPAGLLAAISALLRTLTRTDLQPDPAAAEGLGHTCIPQLPQGMQPEAGQNACFPAAG